MGQRPPVVPGGPIVITQPGEVLGFLGPNGSGKTTTLRMIMGILRPDRGSVTLLGGDSDGPARRRVGYLPEERGVYKTTDGGETFRQVLFVGEEVALVDLVLEILNLCKQKLKIYISIFSYKDKIQSKK